MTVERKLYWMAGLISGLVIAAALLMPETPVSRDGLPWQIEHPEPGRTRIFGLTLGSSSAGEAEQRFRAEAVTSLFRSPEGQLAAEMFFEQVTLSGLKARVVISIAAPATELQAMYERGLRISATGGGKKITPAPEDAARLRLLPVAALTYMPAVPLDEEILVKRFGQPGQRIREKGSGIVHWLYPEHGLDVAWKDTGKPVLQYVSPKDFSRLLEPLLASGEGAD
jgi:hypothetical protein